MTPSSACIALVQQFEGCARRQADGTFAAYPDPGTGGDPWTIGWGSTGPDIKTGLVWTQQQCDDRRGSVPYFRRLPPHGNNLFLLLIKTRLDTLPHRRRRSFGSLL